jgi:hypothetical protein
MSLTIADLKTGYFADPEKPSAPFPFVHAIKTLEPYGVEFPLCDAAISAGHEYQWCAPNVEFTYVDCQPCRNILDRMAQAEGRGQLALFRHPTHV